MAHPYKPNDRNESIHPLVWCMIGGGAVAVAALAVAMFLLANSDDKAPSLPLAETSPSVSVLQDVTLSFQDSNTTVSESRQITGEITNEHSKHLQDTLTPTEIFDRVAPAVVGVDSVGSNGRTLKSGSGFLVSSDGLVVTNHHVVAGAFSVEVVIGDLRRSILGVVATNPDADIAIIKVSGGQFPFLQVASINPPVGTRVYAIGNPRGLAKSLSEGLVSGYRTENGNDILQTTAPISPGSSGGPLVDPEGNVVGVTTAVLLGGQNLNFAMPCTLIQDELGNIKKPRSIASVNAELAARLPLGTTIQDDSVLLPPAWEELRNEKYGEGLSLLARIPETRRGSGYWLARGYAHFWLQNFTESLTDYEHSAQLAPHAQNLMGIAMAAEATSQPQKAKTACEIAIKLSPDNSDVYNVLGILRRGSNEYDTSESVGAFRTAVALDPNNLAARYNLGIIYLRRRDARNAVAHFEVVLASLNERRSFGHLPFTGRSEGFSESCSLEVLSYFGLGDSLQGVERYAEAEKCYQEILKQDPENAMAYGGLCLTYRGWRNDVYHPDAKKYAVRAEQLASGAAKSGGAVANASLFEFLSTPFFVRK